MAAQQALDVDGGEALAILNDVGVIDTMFGLPSVERRDWQDSMAAVLRDKGSRGFTHPAGYMFKHTPDVHRDGDSIDRLLFEMDRSGIERGFVPVGFIWAAHTRLLLRRLTDPTTP